MDAPAHTLAGGASVESFFVGDRRRALYGPALLIKLGPARWQTVAGAGFHWEVSIDELRDAVLRVTGSDAPPDRLLLSVADLPTDRHGQHDPAYALTLSREAAAWLLSNDRFCTYGTSYKSTDFQPGRRERPIHALLFSKAALFECLDLAQVPEGRYFWVAFPLRLAGASESPVCPVLFEREELAW
jgi:kynurenine formamidase